MSTVPSKAPAGPPREGLRQSVVLVLSLLVCGLALAFLLWSPFRSHGDADKDQAASSSVVQVVEPGTISIKQDSVLEKKLSYPKVLFREVKAPILSVPGSVAARLAGGDSYEARWDFANPELATAYPDWLKARNEEGFALKQLATMHGLTQARVTSQAKVVTDLRGLVEIGTDAKKDLIAAEAALLQTRLQGQKDDFDAEATLRNATRARVALERQLYQAGIDPLLLDRKAAIYNAVNVFGLLAASVFGPAGTVPSKLFDHPIVVAEVPETKISLVAVRQACQAEFFAVPRHVFSGKVASLSPTLNRERRTLRVYFELSDPDNLLRPGYFAQVGLGTQRPKLLLIPSEAVIHHAESDYVLTQAGDGRWQATKVKVGEVHGADIEILDGVADGVTVIGKNAILLKPFLVQALARKQP